MALRREDLTPDQLVLQQGLDRSWADLQLVLGDEAKMAFVRAQIRRLDERPTAKRLTRGEFDALAELVE